jgi:hypothetical protein
MSMQMNDLMVELNEEQGSSVQGGFSFNLPFFATNEPTKLLNAIKKGDEATIAAEREQAANYSSFAYLDGTAAAGGRQGIAMTGTAFGAPPLGSGSGINLTVLNSNAMQFFWK